MSVDVSLKASGFFKKPLQLEDILQGKLEFGTMDSWILKPNVVSEDLVVYDPKAIARGITIEWNPQKAYVIDLHLLLPTTRHEVEVFYELIAHIADYWKLKSFEQDGEQHKLSELPRLQEAIQAFSNECLYDFLAKHDTGCFFSALHPLYYDETDVEEMKINFATYLHRHQSSDLYYARVHIYQKNEQNFFGAYTLTSGVDSILPLVPEVPFGFRDPQTQADLQVNEWYLMLYDDTADKVLGQLPYDVFSEAIHLAQQERYDAKTRILKGLSVDTMKQLIEEHRVTL